MEFEFFRKRFLLVVIISLVSQLSVIGQEVLTGKVYDSEDGESLPGVNIAVKGTTMGGATNSEGEFSIRVPSLEDTLVVSFIGYLPQEIPINGRVYISIALEQEILVGEEIVALGYSDQRQKDVTGAISTVSSEEIKSIGRTSVNQMLQGQAAGLNLQTRSAQPGGGVTVNIRGAISPNGNNTPLYVIDGVPITNNSSSVAGLEDATLGFFGGIDRDPLSYLNPNDIESISILKDASATAIYGSSAANGVILITTKSGRAGAVQVNYSGSLTMQRTRDYFPMLTGNQFMVEQDRLAYDRYLFDNGLFPYGTNDPSSVPAYQPLFTEQEILDGVTGTDWFDLIFRDGLINEHNLSVSGGNENTKVFTSFNYQDNTAVLENSKLTRYSGRLNVEQKLSNVITLSVKSTVGRLLGSNASTGGNIGGSETFNMIQAAYAYSPVIEVFDENGNFNSTHNPLIMSPAAFLEISDNTETSKIFAAPKIEVQFLPSLKLTGIAQVDYESTNRNFYLPRITNNTQLPDGMAQKNENTIENYSAESYLTYTSTVFGGDLSVVFGAGYYETSSSGFSLEAVGFFTDAFRDNNVGVATELLQNSVNSYRNQRTKLSQFFRSNYSFKDRYILSVVARRDGSSIFSENNQYGIFPGISLAWILSEEKFLNDYEKLSSLKLRIGYGQSGNESILSGNTLELYSPGYPFVIGQTAYNGIALSQVANPDLTWETVTTINLGIDFGVFTNRIIGKFDLYQRTANDLLDFNQLPSNNAVGIVADNVGSTRSEGIELELNTSNILSNKFSWYSNFNISYNKSYWNERNPRVALSPYIGENDELGTIYGWKTDGIIQSEDDIPVHMPDANLGNVIYVDINNDGRLDSEDVVKIGNSVPRWRIGFGNDFNYRGFDLSIYMYGSLDFQIYNNYAPNIFSISQSTNPSNTTNLIRDTWSADNTEGTRPGLANNPYDGNNPAGSDFDLENGDFIRISNINFGYTFPSKFLGSINSARIFISMQDIALITNYSGFDPEFSEPNPYPASYSTTLGIDINF
ncbi:MAG: SusC/RagA family TonB-linked outer membrane protein [Balneola sp.]|nr:MAG: SusC/RagA family TonB-linked outer membrane protein [Balneola sp.]